MARTITTKERDNARAKLRAMLKPGDTVYTILRHVSASGMSRRISLCIADKQKNITIIDWYCETAGLAKRHHKYDGLQVSGCGMDMGFNLVYNLGAIIWPKGTPKPHGTRNGTPDKEGGYALKHRWL